MQTKSRNSASPAPLNNETRGLDSGNTDLSVLLNPGKTSGSLFDGLFEAIEGSGDHEFAELAIPCARPDSESVSTLNDRKRCSGRQALRVAVYPDKCVMSLRYGSIL